MKNQGIMPSQIDLSDEVTVFIATVGDRDNYADCVARLERQDVRFRYEVIDHVAPMSAAFQAMIDRCQTPYYVQVDEDMLLYPHAIRILHQTMSRATPQTAMVCYSLWDQHMQRAMLGVKIYRADVMRQFPYRLDVPHCDMEQLQRMQAGGYTFKQFFPGYMKSPACIGEHGCHYSPESAYEAYFNRAAKSRLFPEWMSWSRKLLADFWQRIQARPSDIDLYAMLGFAAGLTTSLEDFNHEKDWRTPCHDFRRVQADMETHTPTQLNLHVTSRCNLACRWCQRQGRGFIPQPDMPVSVLTEVCEVCPSLTQVCLAGFGEPLLCSTLPALIAEAKRLNLFVGIITNGVLLEDFAPHLATWQVDRVSVSLNAATAEDHEAINGTKTWDRVLYGIEAAVKHLPKAVDVSMVCTQNNLATCGAFLELAHELDVARVDFVNLLPQDGSTIDDNETFWSEVLQDTPETRQALAELKEHEYASMVRVWPVLISRNGCPRRCRSPYVSISMDANGQVSPCRRVMPPSCHFGGLPTKQDPRPPWRLTEWYLVRSGLEGDRPLPDVCQMCFANWSEYE